MAHTSNVGQGTRAHVCLAYARNSNKLWRPTRVLQYECGRYSTCTRIPSYEDKPYCRPYSTVLVRCTAVHVHIQYIFMDGNRIFYHTKLSNLRRYFRTFESTVLSKVRKYFRTKVRRYESTFVQSTFVLSKVLSYERKVRRYESKLLPSYESTKVSCYEGTKVQLRVRVHVQLLSKVLSYFRKYDKILSIYFRTCSATCTTAHTLCYVVHVLWGLLLTSGTGGLRVHVHVGSS